MAALPRVSPIQQVVARPLTTVAQADGITRDKLAFWSLLCGLFPVLPIFSQIAGIALAVMSMRRPSHPDAQRRGPWLAIAGLGINVLALLGWIGLGYVLLRLYGYVQTELSALGGALP